MPNEDGGLIGKRSGSPYVSRRSDSWIKLIKHRQEFVIVGFTDPKGARSGFGALVLALTDKGSGELRYAGKVGTGFTESTLATIRRCSPWSRKAVPVANPPKGLDAKGIHWLKPELLAEVMFAEITSDGVVWHAVFHGIRTDKPAKDITVEKAPAPKRRDPSRRSRPNQQTARSGSRTPIELSILPVASRSVIWPNTMPRSHLGSAAPERSSHCARASA